MHKPITNHNTRPTQRRSNRAILMAGIALTSLGGSVALSAHAQDTTPSAEAAAPPASDETVVVVTGIRKSLENALRTKRGASQIVDAISAEDIGKLPDQNVAESLQRITGVQIGRSVGQGASVAIRGLPQNRYEIDGATLTGNGGGNSVSFDSIPSELFGSLEVIKSPTADMTEGALGGTIRMNTIRPLDLKGLTITGSARAAYSDFRDAWDPEVSGLIANKWNTSIGQIGALLDLSYSEQSLRNDNLEVSSWNRVAFGDLDGSGSTVGATSGALTPDEVWRPGQIRLTSQEQDRKRTGVLLSLQWKPNSDVSLRLTSSYTKFQYDIDSRLLRLDVGSGLAATTAYTRDSDGTLSSATINNLNFITNNFFTPENQTNFTHQFEGVWKATDRLTLSTLVNVARGRDDVSLQLYPTLNIAAPTTLSYAFNGGDSLPTVTLPTFDFSNLSNYKLNTVVPQTKDTRNDEDAYSLDLKYRFDVGPLQDIQVGYRYGKRFVSQHNNNNSAIGTSHQGLNATAAADLLPGAYSTTLETGNDFMNGIAGELPRGWGGYDGDWLQNHTQDLLQFAGLTLPVAPDLVSWYDVTLKTSASYVRGNLAGNLFSIPYSGNIGVRVVSTASYSGAYLGANASSLAYTVQKNSYTDTLPSANISFDVRDDVIVRFAAAKVVARPDPSQLSAATSRNNGLQTASSGNPDLNPFRATQFDASAEWYFAPGSVLTLAGFYKDVAAFIDTRIDHVTIANPEFPGKEDFLLTHPVNGASGKVKGLEFDYQQNFTMLPSPFDGLGIQANYTYVDSTTPNKDPQTGEGLALQNLSKDSYNIVAYYEKYGASFRLAYNWRSEYLAGTISGSPIYNGAYGQLDAGASYDLNKHLTLTFDAININNALEHTYQTSETRLLHLGENGSRYMIGLRARY